MAWIKEVEQQSTGAVALYWEVISINYTHREQISVMVVGGWVSEVAYQANKDPLTTRTYDVPAGAAPELASGALRFVTGYARAQSEFEGSSDA